MCTSISSLKPVSSLYNMLLSQFVSLKPVSNLYIFAMHSAEVAIL